MADDVVVDEQGRPWHQTTDPALWARAFLAANPGHRIQEDPEENESVMADWFALALAARQP